jgi:hypothetical protein
MGKVVNLNKYREKKERDERATRTTEVRPKSGHTKKERAASKTEALRHDQTLDDKQIEEPEGPPGKG